MRDSFPYPLPEWALRRFCALRGVLGQPVRIGAEVVAGNGHVCLRATRGMWIDADFPEASPEVAARVERLPWNQWTDDQAWKPMVEALGVLYRRGPLDVWLGENLAPCPLVRVASGPVARASLLQLVAKLPRAEVYVGAQTLLDPVRVRFSGGRALIAYAKAYKHCLPAWEIFKPQADRMTGEVRHVAPRGMCGNLAKPPEPEPPIEDWPPAEPDFS